MPPLPRIENLDVAIGSVGVLRNVDMELPAGKFAGLIGQSLRGEVSAAPL